MRQLCLIAALSFSLAAAPTTGPTRLAADDVSSAPAPAAAKADSIPLERRSTDGELLPDVTAKFWWSDAKLGVIGYAIGALPEDVGAGHRVFSLSSSNGTAKRAREFIGNSNIDAADYDWVVTGLGNTAMTLIKLTDGRVSGVCLMGPTEASVWKSTREVIARSGITQSDGFRVGQLNFHIRTSGTWSKTSKVWEGTPGHQTQTNHTTQHPAAMMIEVDRFDWKMATNCQTKESYASVLAGKVKVGMSMVEAYLAMRNYELKRVRDPKTPNVETWVWTGEMMKNISSRIYRTDFGTTVVTEQQISDRAAARARFEDGRVASFEWIVD